ncbi:hypothetical protein [Roseovarius mucosus]|uniref:hypothetical protein n=1 Tax=Roseovarius mucosus TaxID=215743 RepID=UPI0035D0E785
MSEHATVKPDFEGFAKAILEDWPTGDIDGADLFQMSVSYGMIQEVPGGYDPEQHIDAEGISPERGDPWYEYTFRGEAGPGLYSMQALKNALAEMTRRRDEWRKKAEGYDAVRLALREKVGDPWPPHMSRVLWAGISADQKKRADDAEAKLAEALAALDETRMVLAEHEPHPLPVLSRVLSTLTKLKGEA